MDEPLVRANRLIRCGALGVRMAIGASRRAVLGMVLASAMGMTLAGIVAGVALTLGATRLMQG